MTYLAIMNWDLNNRVIKFNEFDTLVEAQALTVQGGILPGTNIGAFTALNPGGGQPDWLCDPINKTVIYSPLPPPTQAELDAIKDIKATAGLTTVQNKTILDALNELRRAIKGEIVLPTETKAQYATRLKAMWVANEP